jgi:hypothetical protein
MNSIQKYPKYNIIGFLSIVIVLTTIISEYFLVQPVREGFNPFAIIEMFIKLILHVGDMFLGIFQLVMWGFQMIGKVPELVIWLVLYIISWITALANIPVCSLFYFLQTIGWVIYLIIRLFYACIDKCIILIGYLAGSNIKFYLFQEIDYIVWCGLEDLDKIIHAMAGIHIIHYPDSVIAKCYSGPANPFPKLPPFPQEAIDNIASALN